MSHGATQGDVAPGLRLQFRDLFRHDVGNHRGVPVWLREGPRKELWHFVPDPGELHEFRRDARILVGSGPVTGHQRMGDSPEHESTHRKELPVQVAEELVVHPVPADVPVGRLEESVQGHRLREDDLAHSRNIPWQRTATALRAARSVAVAVPSSEASPESGRTKIVVAIF